ncbi:MAG TPA: hypothetical protein VN859_00295, partial [Steroidobacteraceae bacterium]|nr:hypothetical protein [Steroidobacteraceae bacterium]
MSAKLPWLALLGAPLLWSLPAADAEEPPTVTASPQGAQMHLRAALDALQAQSNDKAETEILAVIADPGFSTLGVVAQRVALGTAASLALRSNQPEQAQQFAIRATELSGAGIDDWQLRLSASLKLHDARDEAIALTAIAHDW